MKQFKARILYIKNGAGLGVGRVTIPREVLAECGFPDKAEGHYLGPDEEGGPAWILEPEVKK